MLHNLTRRLGKIEKDIGKDKPVWLRLPRKMVGEDGDPEELIEIVGCRNIVDLITLAYEAEESKNDHKH